jgi:hypothetical protein
LKEKGEMLEWVMGLIIISTVLPLISVGVAVMVFIIKERKRGRR